MKSGKKSGFTIKTKIDLVNGDLVIKVKNVGLSLWCSENWKLEL